MVVTCGGVDFLFFFVYGTRYDESHYTYYHVHDTAFQDFLWYCCISSSQSEDEEWVGKNLTFVH